MNKQGVHKGFKGFSWGNRTVRVIGTMEKKEIKTGGEPEGGKTEWEEEVRDRAKSESAGRARHHHFPQRNRQLCFPPFRLLAAVFFFFFGFFSSPLLFGSSRHGHLALRHGYETRTDLILNFFLDLLFSGIGLLIADPKNSMAGRIANLRIPF